MIRAAVPADLPALRAIRNAAGAERLSDPRAVPDPLLCRSTRARAVWVWQAAGEAVLGFAAIDRDAGVIIALLVAPGQQGRGIGRALLHTCCDALRAAGHAAATIGVEPGSPAERHYHAAGWTETAPSEGGGLILQKPL